MSAICVLGMSRSGTSLTARVLALAGVYLGTDDDLLGGDLHQIPAEDRDRAAEANPGGFWEHYEMMRLNERLLRRLGGSWREPPELPTGWWAASELAAEREEARLLIEKTFAGHSLWGWKDPRNSLTLPFWQALLPDLRCVVCLRDPVDVALSLQKRDGMPLEHGLALWRTYTEAALVNTAGRPRIVVSYEAYFTDPMAIAASLAGFVGEAGAFSAPDAERALHATVDRSLWRQRTGGGPGGDGKVLPAEIAALHRFATRLSS